MISDFEIFQSYKSIKEDTNKFKRLYFTAAIINYNNLL